MRKIITLIVAVVFTVSAALAQSTFCSKLPAKARKGGNIFGVVEVNGKPLAGVEVSDGVEVTTTDKKGCYSIASQKKFGNVFITLPSGYEMVPEKDMVPPFWANLTAPVEEAERHDFALRKVDNNKHAIMAITDIHLANMLDDGKQFRESFLPRLKEEIEKYRSQGIPVYTMCMGDSSFDLFWYDYLYDIASFRKTLTDVEYPTQIFHVTGNHDHDGATPADENTDFNSAKKYRATFGPSYYSFNIGGVHYVMLDNIVYRNEESKHQKAGRNIVGKRNYDHYVTDEQLDWLKKDLALVTDKETPIVVGMHCPVYRYKNRIGGKIETLFRTPENNPNHEKADKLSELFKDFKAVHFVTGHTHKNLTCYGKDDAENWPMIGNTIDHNIAAVCGAWWYTGAHGGLHLGPDGAPAGFEVFTMDGRDIKWYLTSIDDGSDVQFRAFDLNSVRDYYNNTPEVRVFLDHFDKRRDYGQLKSDNKVMIHVWAWEPAWKISVKENGKELPVSEQKKMENPQYTISYDMIKAVWDRGLANNKKFNHREVTPHMFIVQASAPDTTLEITVTDTFGKEYKQVMERPKAFSKTMR